MKYVVVDLEMNPLGREYKTEKEICRNEIIEIGAVALDEDYNEIGSFVTFVKPQMNSKIEKWIENLTGITTDMVLSAPCFAEAIRRFFDWCDNIQDDLQVIQWSDSDREQFFREMLLKNVCLAKRQEELISGCYDFQKEYGETLGVEQQVSLKNALMYAGVEFVGREHDALFDAKNTAVLLKTVRIPELCKLALENVINAFKTKPVTTSIGDMFDFSKLELSA